MRRPRNSSISRPSWRTAAERVEEEPPLGELVYIVHAMKEYGVASVRERLAEALDYADQGVPVFIERRGVRYRLSVDEATKPASKARKSYLEVLDPVIETGEWAWNWSPGSFTLKAHRGRK